MSFSDMNTFVVIAITILAGTGITLFFVGALISVAQAFGHKQNVWGVLCIVLLPLSLVYCLLHFGNSKYPLQYLGGGIALLGAALLSTLFL